MDAKLLAKQIRALAEECSDPVPLLSNASALLNEAMDNINWVGFYLVKDGGLVLGPFQGKPACVRIAKGRGVCGTALASGKSQLVPDVHAFPGHIACDSASASEVVIPLRDRSGAIRGVLDIDSPLKGRFTEDDLRDLEAFTAALASVTAWDL